MVYRTRLYDPVRAVVDRVTVMIARDTRPFEERLAAEIERRLTNSGIESTLLRQRQAGRRMFWRWQER